MKTWYSLLLEWQTYTLLTVSIANATKQCKQKYSRYQMCHDLKHAREMQQTRL